jgi:hypothetical protein
MGRTVWWGRHMQTRNANLVIGVAGLGTEQEMRDLDSIRGDSRRENA